MQLAQALQIVGQFRTVLRFAPAEKIARIAMGMAHVIDPRDQGAEHLAVRGHAAHAHAAEIDAMIAALAPDQAHALAFAALAVIGDGDLQRRLDRLRTRIGEEDVVQAAGHQGGEARGQSERLGMAHLEGGGIIQLRRLLCDGFDDPGAAMAGIAAPQPGNAVQHVAAIGGLVIHALRADEEARIGLELPIGGERHPIGVEIVGLVHRVQSVVRIGLRGCSGQVTGGKPLARGFISMQFSTGQTWKQRLQPTHSSLITVKVRPPFGLAPMRMA